MQEPEPIHWDTVVGWISVIAIAAFIKLVHSPAARESIGLPGGPPPDFSGAALVVAGGAAGLLAISLALAAVAALIITVGWLFGIGFKAGR